MEQPACDPPVVEPYLQQDLEGQAACGGQTATGDIDASKAGLAADGSAAAAYLMNPFVEASLSISRYKAMWDFLLDEYGELSHSKNVRMYKWLLHHTAISKKRNVGLKETHLALNNGRFHIPAVAADAKRPNDREEIFLKYYAEARMLGLRQFFVETRTPVFRYFMDLDFKQPAELPPRSMEAAAFVVCRTLRRFWPGKAAGDAFFRCVVSTTNYKLEPARAGEEVASKVKSGVHLIWPEIYLNDAMALDIRESVIADLQETFGPRAEPAMNSWQDVVDLTVYKGSGLRMIGSCKTETCPACKRKGVDEDGNTCKTCGGNRSVDAGRPYMPLCALDGSGRRDLAKEAEYLASFYRVVLDTTIRSHAHEVPDEGFVVPEGALTYDSGSGSSAFKRAAGKGPAGGAAARGGSGGGSGSAGKSMMDLCSDAAALLQSFLRTGMGGGSVYASVGLQSVLVNAKRTKFLANVQGLNATYCLNAGRCHKSNRVYFEVTAEGCVQRCHDQGDTQERFGLCKDYRSATVRLPQPLFAALFPEAAAKQDVLDNLGADVDMGAQGGGGAENEAAAAALDMRHDLKMRSLLAAGDQLSLELHGMEWSSTVQVHSSSDSRKLRMVRMGNIARATQSMAASARKSLPMYAEVDPSALGCRADEALRALGFCALPEPAAEAASAAAAQAEEPQVASQRMLLDTLEVALLRQLKNAIHLAVSLEATQAKGALLARGLEGLLTAGRKAPLPARDDAQDQAEAAAGSGSSGSGSSGSGSGSGSGKSTKVRFEV
jgi:uncharacterized membrane protein YgcG